MPTTISSDTLEFRAVLTSGACKPLATAIALVSFLSFASSGRADTLAVVTSQSAQNANDSVSWAPLGGDGTILGSNFSVSSATGISVSVGLAGPNSIVSIVCSANPSSSCSWTGRNATANDTLLWTSDAQNGGNGPLTLVFSTAIGGAGAVIQADAPGQFTAQIQAYNGTNSLGSFSLTSDSNGDPLYIGVTDQSGANITSVAFNLSACTDFLNVCTDFALDTVSLSTASVSVNPNSLSFTGQALSTTSSPQSVTLSNFTSSAVTITNIATSGDFATPNNTCGTSVAANGSCTISVTFTPTVSGTRTGTLTITDSAGNSPQTVSLTGSGPAAAATLSPSPLTFSGQLVGSTSSAQNVTVQNTGTATLNVSGASIGGTNLNDFNISNNPCTSVNAGNSCMISITFTPGATGTRTATLSVTDNAGNSPQSINLSGTGTSPVASVAPNSLTFQGQLVQTNSAPQIVTLGNTGTGPLSVSKIAITGDFAQTNNCNGSVAAGGTCNINVTFTPTTTGTRTGTLTITDSASGSPQSVSVTGTGTDPVVSLSPNPLPAFPSTVIGSTSAGQNVVLTNTGTAPLSIGNIMTTGDFAETDNCPFALPSTSGSNSCTITVTFTPTASGPRTGNLTFTDDARNSPQSVGLSGIGVTGPAASLTPTTGLSFSGQLVGTPSAAQAVTVTNSGGATLTLSGYSITGTNSSDFSIVSGGTCTTSSALAASASCTIKVTFKPTATGARSATISVSDNASNSPQTLGLTGTGTQPAITFNPSPSTGVAFGNQAVNSTSAAKTVTVTNSGTATLTLNSISITGTNQADFGIPSTGTCTSSTSLAPNGSCTINVTFTPASAATFSANLSVGDNAPASPQTVPLSGTGTVPGISFTPSAGLAFGNVNVGSPSSAMSETVKNTGTSTLTLTGISVTGSNLSDFSVASGGTCTSSTSLAPNGTCTINVIFQPSATGARTASISVADNAPSSPQSFGLTGTGTQPGLSLTPSAGLSFGTVTVGSASSAMSATATNTGSSTVTLSGISVTGSNLSDFSIASGGTCTSSTALAPNGTCTINVIFKPSATGARTASLSVADNAPGSPQTLNLSGMGGSTVTPPANGRYTISNLAGTLFLDVPGASKTNGASVDIAAASGATSQQWTLTAQSNGSYIVNNVNSSLDLDDTGNNPNAGVALVQYTPSTASNHQWTLASSGGGWTFQNGSSKLFMAGGTTAGTTVTQQAAGAANEVWVLTPVGSTGAAVNLNPSTLTFPIQQVGTTSSSQPITLKNTGGATLSITSIAASGDFAQTNTCGSSLGAGASCTISVTFKPTTTGTRTGSISVTDNASGSPQSANLSGTGTNTTNPPPANGVYTVSNSAGTLFLDVPGASTANATPLDVAAASSATSQQWTFTAQSNGNYIVNNVNSKMDLDDPGNSTTAGTQLVQYTPSTATNHQWTLAASGNGWTFQNGSSKLFMSAGSSAGANVTQQAASQVWVLTPVTSGGGSPGVNLNPGTLTFSRQQVGTTSASQSVTLKNTGTAALSITSITASGDFAQTNTCGSSLAAAASCSITVTFKPTATGTRAGNISVTDNASGSPQTAGLTGSALPANGTYTVTNAAGTLVWDDPGNATLAGTLIDLWPLNGGSNQKWTFTSVGNGYYTITNGKSTLVLDDPGLSTMSGTKLDQWTSNGGTNQHWLLTVSGSGFTIQCQSSSLFVDASTNTQSTDIVQATASGASTQVWTIH